MISGAYVMIFSQDEAADRAFLRDVLEIPCIGDGEHWLTFKLPPAELGVHSHDRNDLHQIYLICDDVDAFVARMEAKGVETLPIKPQDWGRSTGVKLPGGGTLGVYEAHHARA
jgi:hypothetical protein